MRRLLALPCVLFVSLAWVACEDDESAPSNPLPVSKVVGGNGVGGGGVGGLGSGGSGACEGAGSVIEAPGAPNRILLRGAVATPTTVLPVGEVLVEDNLITCVAASCADQPGASGATVVNTNGIIFPGLIDTHNHILFDIFDEDDWVPEQQYDNHDQWPNEDRYGAMVDTKQYLNGESGSPAKLSCEMLKFGEMKGLIAGTTSIQGSPGAVNRSCYGSLSRTIDQSANDLDDDNIQTATIFPSKSAADGVCTNFGDGDTNAYIVHIGEGVDQKSLDEFAELGAATTTPECLYSPNTTIVHGTALGPTELGIMAANGMSLSWSPQSNVFLYGSNTDLTKTTDIPTALDLGINIAISPDWSMGGSQNLLDELRFADRVDNEMWGDRLSPAMLAEMVTINAAHALGLESVLGSLEPGKRADIMVIRGDGAAPFDALLAARPKDVALVLVDGRVLYGDANLVSLGPTDPGCEMLDICCASKFACVSEISATPDDKLGQSFAEIQAALNQGLQDYDDMDLTEWNFAPLPPVVKCQ